MEPAYNPEKLFQSPADELRDALFELLGVSDEDSVLREVKELLRVRTDTERALHLKARQLLEDIRSNGRKSGFSAKRRRPGGAERVVVVV